MSELAGKTAKGVYAAIQLLDYAELADSQRDQEKCAVIEQALLAERRLAKLEDAEIADQWANSPSCDVHEYDPCCHVRTGAGIAQALRTAAEKEAVTR